MTNSEENMISVKGVHMCSNNIAYQK